MRELFCENSISARILHFQRLQVRISFKFTRDKFILFVGVMGRKKGFDERKIGKIVSILAANPDGIWVRQIAKQAGYSPPTITHYVKGILAPVGEDPSLGTGKPLLRVIRLKPFVIEKLQEGRDISQIMKILRLVGKIQ